MPHTDARITGLPASVRDVHCVFPDINGHLRGKVVRAADFRAGRELRIAEAIALQTIDGHYPPDEICGDADQDAVLRPVPAQVRVLPWAPASAMALHECLGFDGRPSAFSSRAVLQRVLADYAGCGLRPVVAPEIEFYLFDRACDLTHGFEGPKGRGGVREVGQSAYALDTRFELAAFWNELDATLTALEIAADTWLHEVGANQYEINLCHGDALDLADQVLWFKLAVREVAARHGLMAVFMAKPVADLPGSSMHLHISVVDAAGDNIFADAQGADTEAFEHFIGGLQRGLPCLMPLFAPYVNSWRRYVSGSQAPINLEWAVDNRTVALRVPASGRAARRVENRLAGSDANPYLAMAASLASGLHGLQQRLPRRPAIGPRNAYEFPRELPAGPESGLVAMEQNPLPAQWLGQAFVDAYLACKATELDSFMSHITAWERRFLAMAV